MDMMPAAEAAAAAVAAQVAQQQQQRMNSNSYRQREATHYKGVTKTSGINSGMEKYDVQ